MRRPGVLTVIRVLLGIIFATYGLVKVLGGQYNYGDWVIAKRTAEGTSLVWAFYGYSPFYGRFTGLFELVPAILLLIPRTATIGAAALFAVALNVTAMDFGFHYPAVKYFALTYTILLGVLLWADRRKLALLLLDSDRVASLVIPPARAPQPTSAQFSPTVRRVLFALGAVMLLAAANVTALAVSKGPDVAARRALASRVQPTDSISLLRSRQNGLVGLDWNATVDFAVLRPSAVETVTVRARKITALLPWRVTEIGGVKLQR